MTIRIIEREMADAEYGRMLKGFVEHGLEFGVPDYKESRYGFVAMDGDAFIGCVSGLQYEKWFYITDLWLEKPYRKQGYGRELLRLMEDKVRTLDIQHIWTWTSGYEGAAFYPKCGYTVFCEFENYYPSGHNRIGVRKAL